MRLVSYLHFDGACEAAFRFYAACLDGEVVALHRYGDSPMAGQVDPANHAKVMHAALEAEGATLYGSDAVMGAWEGTRGFQVAIGGIDEARAEAIFARLAEGAVVTMPLQPTFWSKRFGMLTDRFGVPWLVNVD